MPNFDSFSLARRTLLTGVLLGTAFPRLAMSSSDTPLHPALAKLEHDSGGRLGVSALDTASGKRIAHRADERFAMCSTFKFLLAAMILRRVDSGSENLKRMVAYSRKDLLEYAPITSKHVARGKMSIGDLCAATLDYSDNTAANLLLAQLGGPDALTAFLRSLGDNFTRLDRIEPELNSAEPGDPRDTTTPAAMLETMHTLLLAPTSSKNLHPTSQQQMFKWLKACTTGADRLSAGVPDDWKCGDKTGSGSHGSCNDIAILWPPKRAPILVTAYYTESALDAKGRNAVLEKVGTIVTLEMA